MTRIVKVTLETVTPLFTGGPQSGLRLEWSEQQQRFRAMRGTTTPRDELRPDTIKGLMAFWYRALHPEEMPERSDELRIFGSSKTKTGGSAVFRLEVASHPRLFTGEPQAWDTRLQPMEPGFFFGQGKALNLSRSTIPPDQQWSLCLRFGPRARAGDIGGVLQALWALATFGGIGARSRHGWGSVRIHEIRIDGQLLQEHERLRGTFTNVEEFRAQVQENLADIANLGVGALPAAPNLSAQSVLSNPGQLVWSSALVDGRNDVQTWQRANIDPDHRALVSAYVKNMNPTPAKQQTVVDALTQIAVFGLPMIYQDAGATLDATGANRRASPLFLSVKRIGNEWHALQTFLPATFLPVTSQLQLRPSRGGGKPYLRWQLPSPGTLYNPILSYLAWLQIRKGATKIL